MSLETPIEVKSAKEFLTAQDLFVKIGFEIVGTKDINNKILYVVKEKKG